MDEKDKFNMYRKYLVEKWKDSEDIASADFGVTDNMIINSIFNKLVEPYSYWRRRFNH